MLMPSFTTTVLGFWLPAWEILGAPLCSEHPATKIAARLARSTVALPNHIILPVAFLSMPLILSLSLLCDGAERRTFAPPWNGTVAA
jgi:hypothetical protein